MEHSMGCKCGDCTAENMTSLEKIFSGNSKSMGMDADQDYDNSPAQEDEASEAPQA